MSGHVVRMAQERLPKQLLYGELVYGKRLAQKPKMRYKDCLNTTLKKCGIDEVTWKSKALDRGQLRKVYDGENNFDNQRIRHNKLKKDVWKDTLMKQLMRWEIRSDLNMIYVIVCGLCLTRAPSPQTLLGLPVY